MCLLGRPSAANNTIRLRNTTRCAVVPARIQPCSVARCSGVIGKAGVRFMWRTGPNPNWKYKTFCDHCTSSQDYAVEPAHASRDCACRAVTGS